MLKLRKTEPTEPLIVSMTVVRTGDRLLVIGCEDPKLVALLATKAGLTGTVCAVDEKAERTARAAALAEREGALMEAKTAPVTMLPFDSESFDVVIVSHLLPGLAADRREQSLAEAARVLRPGGRCIVVQNGRRSGLAGLFGGGQHMSAEEIEGLMKGASFRAVRTLAEREGLVFVEGGTRKD